MTILIATLVLWVAFIAAATLKNKLDNSTLPRTLIIPAYIFGIIFLIGDVAYNITFGSVIFLQNPSLSRLTLTARLKYILHDSNDTTYRYRLALIMCKYMIEPWDFGHCSLWRIK